MTARSAGHSAPTSLTNQKAAHLEALAGDGRLYVAPQAPAIGLEAAAAALEGWPSTFAFGETEGGGVSAAGDLAWTYGRAGWRRGEAHRQGHYVRLWRKDATGWRLVLAQLIPERAGPQE